MNATGYLAQFKLSRVPSEGANVNTLRLISSHGRNILSCKIGAVASVLDPFRCVQDQFLGISAAQQFKCMLKTNIAYVARQYHDDVRVLGLVDHQKTPRKQ